MQSRRNVYCFVAAKRPAAQTKVSKEFPLWLLSLPYPAHRPKGIIYSIPALSAILVNSRLLSQVGIHRSLALVAAIPPEQLAAKMPILNILSTIAGRFIFLICLMPHASGSFTFSVVFSF